MNALADALVCEYSRKGIKDYGEVFVLCKRILDECTDSIIRYEETDTLAIAYDYAGKEDEMLKLALQMPKSRFCYETFMVYRWRGDEGFKARRKYMYSLLCELFSMIGCAAGHIGDNGKFIYSAEEQAELNRLKYDLVKRIFPDGDYCYFACEADIACSRMVDYYLKNGDVEAAWEWLEKGVEAAVHFDTYNFDSRHTSPILKGESAHGWVPEACGNNTQCLLSWLENSKEAAQLRAYSKFPELLGKLKKHAKKP